jgi:hypothetical protein
MELLASPDTIHQLVQKYFTHLYPRYQFPHEGMFNEGLISRHDQVDPSFLSLVASICAVTAQSFPRAARVIFVELEHPTLGASGEAVSGAQDTQGRVEHFVRVGVQARGLEHGLRLDLGVNDAIASFLLAITQSMVGHWQQYRYFMSECLATLKMITIRQQEVVIKNYIDIELATRLEAAVFVHIQ